MSIRAAALPVCLLMAVPAFAGQSVIQQYRGVAAGPAVCELAETLFDQLDQIVGVKARIEPTDIRRGDFHTSAGATNGQLVLYCGSLFKGGTEVVINEPGYRWEHGGFEVDGFFLVKSGGVHQGVVSAGLMPVDEAVIRLSAGVTIRPTMVPH